MRAASALIQAGCPRTASKEAAERVASQLKGAAPHLVWFCGAAPGWEEHGLVGDSLRDRFRDDTVVVGSASGGTDRMGIIGGAFEVQDRSPSLSVLAVRFPESTRLATFAACDDDRLPDLSGVGSAKNGGTPLTWADAAMRPKHLAPSLLLLGRAASNHLGLLDRLDLLLPNSSKVGGIVPDGGSMYCSSSFSSSSPDQTAVGILVDGEDVTVDAVVAQGPTPRGKVYTITDATKGYVLELDGLPVAELLLELSEEAKTNGDGTLFAGVAVDGSSRDASEDPSGGSSRGSNSNSNSSNSNSSGEAFIIRPVVACDRGVMHPKGFILMGGVSEEMVRPGTKIQFHFFAPEPCEAHFKRSLHSSSHGSSALGNAAGALVFSCLGRGEGLYRREDVESSILQKAAAAAAVGAGGGAHGSDNNDREFLPSAGFFGAGEIGPVGARTHLHSFTTCVALFRERERGGVENG